ncbi:MAG: chromosome segregation protein SMC [Chthoniobacteraceae bacterium]
MYLKSLEILGFKSFAPKTLLEFHRGVTCVVGPNGCGKSNVLDAILWVLGEQSAKALRGADMTDVIFSGTDSRSALGMAEVSMTFSECEEALGLDWHEVTITRRVFREGGSEYLLNKAPCRLKDIHNLFMDTGIGRTAYSIMQQGKIDAVLSTRPEDRRAIFEEAAGITKYKSQKKEALRKLEATEVNLVRLVDIIREVKRQIGSLQRQAGKARRYQSLIGDLKMLELHHAKQQWENQDAQRGEATTQLDALSVRQGEHEVQIEAQEAEAGDRRAALDEMETRLTAARQTVNELRTRISNHENRIVFNEERTREFEGLVERYRGDVAVSEERFRAQEAELHSTDTELAQITDMLAAELRHMEEKQVATAALTAQRAEIESAIAGFSQDAGRIESRIHQLRGNISGVVQTREGAEARLAFLADETRQLEFAFAQLTEQRGHAEGELSRAQAEIEAHTAEVTAAEFTLRQSQAILAEIERELRDAQRVLAEKESKAEVLRQLVQSGEGLGEGTQAVLRGLDNPDFFKPAISGALAQLIDVAPEYVAAVEACLGANLQAIVMKDTMIAESVVKTLTSQKLGTAALALRDLDQHFEHVRNEQMALPEGAIDWLINKVRPQPEVARLVERLVNHTVLVPDLETALSIFPQRGSMIVTLAGEIITRDGILHGGVASEVSYSMLDRKNQLHAIEGEVCAARSKSWEVSSRRETTLSEIDGAQARLEEARIAKATVAEQLSSLRGQLGMLDREAKEAERKQQTLEGEQASIEARHAEAAARLAQLEIDISSTTQSLDALQQRRAESQGQLEVFRAQESELAAELNELRIKVATERQRHSSLHHQRAPMESRLTELEQLIAQRQTDITTYEQRLEAAQAENAELGASLETLNARTGDAELEVARLLDERTEIAAEVEEFSNTLRILRHQLTECHDQRSKLEVRASQLEMRASALAGHITKRYQLDIATYERDLHGLRVAVRDALKRRQRSNSSTDAESGEQPGAEIAVEVPTPASEEEEMIDDAFAIDWSVVESLVRELEAKVDSMGPVNIDAIQEFDELEQRYNFLEQQNTDLTNAKAELLETITRINRTTRELFADTFEKIRVNFQEMFTELFGGGKANLVLTDEADPLESGIEIVAKPPGKQLSSISLLSGGERTMTAVALLFAIYMVKPSPFCVLDEMDAPLDESNITRFIKILDRFVDQSQFVVISHNKRTIARADAIYGVTMEEHGISKLVSVKFNTRDKAPDSGEDVMSNSAAGHVPSVAEAFGKSSNLASEDAMAAADGAA